MTESAPPFCEVHGCRGRWDADQPHTLCGKTLPATPGVAVAALDGDERGVAAPTSPLPPVATAARQRVRWAYRRMTLRHLRRWWRERCVRCGRRPYWSESMILLPGTGSFHDACDAATHWRDVAGERLRVLAVVADMWEVDGNTVEQLLAIQARADLADEARARTVGWRVFYDLDNLRKREAQDA